MKSRGILLAFILLISQSSFVSAQSPSPTTATNTTEQKKSLVPFGPVKAKVAINKSVGECRTQSDNADEIRKEILDNFGIHMQDDGRTWPLKQLKLACAKFNDIAKTNFFMALHRGTNGPFPNPVRVRARQSCQYFGGDVPCRSGDRLLDMTPSTANYPDELFLVILIHEIAHDLQFQPEDFSHRSEHAQALNREGFITGYGSGGCNFGTNAAGEDYAEMITYYLNPNARSQSTRCSNGAPPYAGGGKPEHFKVAKAILGEYP